MSSAYRVKLNFLPLVDLTPPFRVYRKLRDSNEAKPTGDVSGFSLPCDQDPDTRNPYWVSFDAATGFEEFSVNWFDNVHLTRRVLFHALQESVQQQLQPNEYDLPKKRFYEELSFNFAEHEEGREQLRVQPYYLKTTKQFGWLVDFHFRVKEGAPFSRRIQQLSLSLDRNFKRNLDCYQDRRNRINEFVVQRRDVLRGIILPGTTEPLSLSDTFSSLSAKRLHPKVYLFSGDKTSRSQFSGLRQHGPLSPLNATPKLLFAFRECDRQAARTLAVALRGSGKRERVTFPGFESLFRAPITFDAEPIILDDLTLATFEKALERVKRDRESEPLIMPIFVLPDGDDNGYMQHKAVFSHEGIPTQVCTLRVINDDYSLKWSIANIALQLFCKAGGQPWKVQPTSKRSLIIGISQSHKMNETAEKTSFIEKYFAFTVMTDNSGLFQQMRVLGDSPQETTYLDELRNNLRHILADNSSEFSQVAVHTSFRLKRKEMQAIEETVREAAQGTASQSCQFAVVKVNHRSRFFGFNPDINSLVPYEGTEVSLGGGEHLVWFEGIFPDNQTVGKAFPGPTHLTFLRVSEDNPVSDEALLQDLVNLSGCNWRGFNAKSAPVSIFYCHLVADFVRRFHDEGLPLPKVQDLRPWFL